MKIFVIFFFLNSLSFSFSWAAFVKTSESEEEKSALWYLEEVVKTIFNSKADYNNFDFHGNEINRPDLTLEKGHPLCLKIGNDSEIFRKFAGLIKNEVSNHFDFARVDELKSIYYSSTSKLESLAARSSEAAPDIIPSPPSSLPKHLEYLTGTTREQSNLTESFVFDLLLTVIPSIQGTLIDCPADMAGILIFMFLWQVEDFEGYFDEFREFYGLLRGFASSDDFDLPAVLTKIVPSKVLIEHLFRLAVKLNLPYTLEVFYNMDLIDFGNCRLLSFVLETADCPVVISRFFDFVPWNDGALIDGIPKIHFVYENYSEYLGILFDYEVAIKIDWRCVDENGQGRTLLGKLLSNLTKSVFNEGQSSQRNPNRLLLKEFLSHEVLRERAGAYITAEKDILMECYENEAEGLRLLAEYLDNTLYIEALMEDYLMRILQNWKAAEVVNLLKIFKFLVKKAEISGSKTISPILIESFDIFNERLSKEVIQFDSRSNSRNSTISNQSGKSIKFSRSSSGTDFFKSLFVDTSATSSNAAMPKSPKSPKAKESLETMRFIVQEAERIAAHDNDLVLREMISHWNNIISSYGYI